MRTRSMTRWTLVCFTIAYFPALQVLADGGYFSRTESIAISTDQRAIIIRNGNQISATFSTGYSGEGEDFGWLIPTPVPPDIEDVCESGENGEDAFQILDRLSAPVFSTGAGGGGCFPAGTDVLTAVGPRAIETVVPGMEVYACELATGEWAPKRVLNRLPRHYEIQSKRQGITPSTF
jgi:hypothetical protein